MGWQLREKLQFLQDENKAPLISSVMLELPVPNDRFLLICFAFSSLRDSPDPKSIYDEIFKGNSSAHFIVFAQKFLSFFLPLRETSPDYNSLKILFKKNNLYFTKGDSWGDPEREKNPGVV